MTEPLWHINGDGCVVAGVQPVPKCIDITVFTNHLTVISVHFGTGCKPATTQSIPIKVPHKGIASPPALPAHLHRICSLSTLTAK